MPSDQKTAIPASLEATLGTILPSYSMFTSTLGKKVTVPTAEEINRTTDPPIYTSTEMSQSSGVSSISNDLNTVSLGSSRTTVSGSSNPNEENSSFIVADENTDYWKETILDNVHHLPNLTLQSHKIPKAINIEIHYTKDVCEVGKKPELIDPSIYEYKQGDSLNGYILIKSESDIPIPYEMFYLVFEGNYMVANYKNESDIVPAKDVRFLEMFDFSGSSNAGNINRLKSDDGNPYVCGDPKDPLDGTSLRFGKKRIITPGRTYKRFFTFKIPDRLLDSECDEHGLSKHLELPPTMGLSRWEVAHYPARKTDRIKDFCPVFDSMSYGVTARYIGRKSVCETSFGKIDVPLENKKLVNSNGDEYIILKELTNHFRVVQKTTIPTDSERLMKLLENKLMYNNLISRIKEKIEMGKQLIESIEKNEFTSSIDLGQQLTRTEIEMAKCKQLYRPDSVRDAKANPNKVEYYETFLPLVKKSLTGSKELGTLKISTPKKEYCVCYIPPPRFRSESIDELTPSWNLEIPLDLSIQFPSLVSKTTSVPTIKSVTAELVVLTISTRKFPIPIELNHDLVFNKQNSGSMTDGDNIETNIIKPFRKYSSDLYGMTQKLGVENYKMERRLVRDIKCICDLKTRVSDLIVEDVKVNGVAYKKDSLPWSIDDSGASTSFNLGINLENLTEKKGGKSQKGVKSYDKFTLVPDFQTCFMSRMYHIKVLVQLSNGVYAHIKVPVRIQKIM